MRTLALPLLVAASFAAPSAAQLGLTVFGGSVPGQVDMTAGPFIPDGTFGVVLVSVQTTTIPLFPLGGDPRSLSVGLELGSVSPFGMVSNGSGLFVGPPLPIPNQASFIDGALYFQSAYLPGPQYFFGPLSEPAAIRFAPANQFRDRGVFLGEPRSFFPSIPLPNGKVLLPGGGSGGLLAQVATASVDLYNEITDQHEFGLFMAAPRSLHTATELLDGRILLTGGVDNLNDPLASTEIYDPVTGLFGPGPSMANPRMGHTATLLPNGNVLVTGGLRDLNQPTSQLDPIFSSQNTTEVFNFVTNTWSAGPNLGKRRAGHAAVTLPDGRVLIAGGIGYTTIIINIPVVERTTDIYNPATNLIAAGPNMVSRRALFSIVPTATGRWFAAGGIDDLDLTNQGTPTTSTELYDAAANTWTAKAAMATSRGLHSAHAWGAGKFIHIMGANGSILSPVALTSTEVYTVATNTWAPGPTSPTARAAFGSYLNSHGQVHVMGGSNNGSPPVVVNSTAWIYR